MKVPLAVATLIVTGAFIACSSSDNSSSGSPTNLVAATSAPAASSATASGNTVDVGIQEWSINPNVHTTKAGSVTFNVRNTGPKEEHEFVILKTDLAPADLPRLDNGSVDEKGAGLTSPGEVEGMAVGDQKTATFDLAPGKYIFICNLIDQGEGGVQIHYKEGMYTEFTVQ